MITLRGRGGHTKAVKMTETYAATIAAVVPVLWLAAVVEMHQVGRRIASLLEKHPVTRARQLIEREGGVGLDAVRAEFLQAKMIFDKANPVLNKRMILTWGMTVMLLTAAEIGAVGRLGGLPCTGPGWAWFCLLVTVGGLIAVASLPLEVVLREASRTHQQAWQDLRFVVDFINRTEGQDNDDASPAEDAPQTEDG